MVPPETHPLPAPENRRVGAGARGGQAREGGAGKECVKQVGSLVTGSACDPFSCLLFSSSMYASVDNSIPSPPGPNCQFLGGDHYSPLLPNQYPVPSRFYPDLPGQAKDVVPQPYWLGAPRDHSYEAEFRAVSMKPAFLPSAPGPTMSYYRSQEVLAPGAGWPVAPQYPPKMGPASWFRPMRTLPMEPSPGGSEGRGPERQVGAVWKGRGQHARCATPGSGGLCFTGTGRPLVGPSSPYP